ncbi:hypothetical protein [Singulisphaera sp. PoT]|uniref:hypothetical protein n=1 Tax=Singulisphaera sp. PoT TaxID=3411797 RepID=UPI003BF4B6D0
MTVWKISGEADNGSNGGPMECIALSPCDLELPAAQEALSDAHPGYEWYRVDSICNIGKLRQGWKVESQELGAFLKSNGVATPFDKGSF